MSSKSFQNASKLNGIVSVLQFGAVGDGVTDDTAAIQAAIDSLGAAGGTVMIPNGKFLIESSITVKPNVTLKGPFSSVGSPKNNSLYDYSLVSSVRLNSSATINLYGSAGVDGLLIYRKGMVFPTLNGESSFAGTAITGVDGICDDMFVFNSMILGFEYAIFSNNAQRPRVFNVNIDCKSGVHFVNCLDVAKLNKVHCWPFSTVGTIPGTLTHRSGNAIYLENADWPIVSECFSYAYYRGLHLKNTNDALVSDHGVDGTTAFSGSIGIVIVGDGATPGGLRTQLVNCQTSSQDIGLYIKTPETEYFTTLVNNCRFSTNVNKAAFVEAGHATFTSNIFEASPDGIGIATSNSIIIATNNTFVVSGSPLAVALGNSKIQLSNNNYSGISNSIVNNNLTIPSVSAVSNVITIPPEATMVSVASGNFNKVNYVWTKREVTLYFAAAGIVVSQSTGAHAIGKLSGTTFTSQIGSTLTLVGNDTGWWEKCRSI